VEVRNLIEHGNIKGRQRPDDSDEQQEAKLFQAPEDEGEDVERNFPVPVEIRNIIHQVKTNPVSRFISFLISARLISASITRIIEDRLSRRVSSDFIVTVACVMIKTDGNIRNNLIVHKVGYFKSRILRNSCSPFKIFFFASYSRFINDEICTFLTFLDVCFGLPDTHERKLKVCKHQL